MVQFNSAKQAADLAKFSLHGQRGCHDIVLGVATGRLLHRCLGCCSVVLGHAFLVVYCTRLVVN